MASITIRDINDETIRKLRIRADKNQRSLEEEARQILTQSLQEKPMDERTGRDIYRSIRKKVDEMGGFDLELPSRKEIYREFGFKNEDNR